MKINDLNKDFEEDDDMFYIQSEGDMGNYKGSLQLDKHYGNVKSSFQVANVDLFEKYSNFDDINLSLGNDMPMIITVKSDDFESSLMVAPIFTEE